MKAILINDFLKTLLVTLAFIFQDALNAYLPRAMIEPLIIIAKKEIILKLSTKANSAIETYSDSLVTGSGMVAFLAS